MSVSIDDIRAAQRVIDGEVVRTPTVRSGLLSDEVGADIFLKLETMQRTGSFKDRGALVKLKSLSAEEGARGVIAVSAGNHAQGVASHAQRLGIPATILMPEGTPFTKVRRTEAFGATVMLQGDTLNEAEPFAHERAEAEGLTFVHPYDDVDIIAGQGTIGLEMLDDVSDLDVIVVPIGGGGIISGIATAVKALRPEVEIIGVETEVYPAMHDVIRGLDRVIGGDTLADGIAVKSPGHITREIVGRLVDDLVLVSEVSIEAAVQSLITEAKLVVEGAGAVGLAAVLEDQGRFEGKRVGLVLCGSNIDPRILASVLMRGMSRAGHLASLRISINDRAGVLGRVAQVIGAAGGNIVETHHQRMFASVSVKRAELDVLVETRDGAHATLLVSRLQEAGFATRLLPDG